MKIVFAKNAWEDYLYWQETDKKILKRINVLIKEIIRSPFQGIGDPEPLKHSWSGFWSRRINKEHRLVYAVEKGSVLIAQCRYSGLHSPEIQFKYFPPELKEGVGC